MHTVDLIALTITGVLLVVVGAFCVVWARKGK